MRSVRRALSHRSPQTRRPGALFLAALLALNLFLPSLHGIASRSSDSRDRVHHAAHCAQCQAFSHARSDLISAPSISSAPTWFGDPLVVASDEPASGADIAASSGSPRSPPHLLALL